VRTILLSTGRNYVLGERHDSRRYQLPSGRIVTVRTIMEMEFDARVVGVRRSKRAERESDVERDRR